MIIDAFKRAFKHLEERKWNKIYVMVDIHGTIFKSSYTGTSTTASFKFAGPDCKRCLQKMTEDERISLILWSSTYDREINDYVKELEKFDIKFDYINSNPEEKSTFLSDFSKKPYFNVLIDDKAGFNAYEDWSELLGYLYPEENEKLMEEKRNYLRNFRWEIITDGNGHKQAKLYKITKTERCILGFRKEIISERVCGEYGTAPSKSEMKSILERHWKEERAKITINKQNLIGDELWQ